jgi:heme/copper-type cytochrome/quinol oxidase subunit 2
MHHQWINHSSACSSYHWWNPHWRSYIPVCETDCDIVIVVVAIVIIVVVVVIIIIIIIISYTSKPLKLKYGNQFYPRSLGDIYTLHTLKTTGISQKYNTCGANRGTTLASF